VPGAAVNAGCATRHKIRSCRPSLDGRLRVIPQRSGAAIYQQIVNDILKRDVQKIPAHFHARLNWCGDRISRMAAKTGRPANLQILPIRYPAAAQ
jgi:hypothetical protein